MAWHDKVKIEDREERIDDEAILSALSSILV